MSARDRRRRIEAGTRRLVQRLDGLAPGFDHGVLELNAALELDCLKRQFPDQSYNEIAARLSEPEADRLMAAYGRLLAVRLADALTPMRREAARRLVALEGRRKAAADDAPDWSRFTDAELAGVRAWCEACGDRPLTAWARTLPMEERERVRWLLVRLAGQSHAA